MDIVRLKYASYGYPIPAREIELSFCQETEERSAQIEYSYGYVDNHERSGIRKDGGGYSTKKAQIEALLSTFTQDYYEDLNVVDGEYWTLEYWLQNESESHKIEGRNAYPVLWECFKDILNKIAGDWFYPWKWKKYYAVKVDGFKRKLFCKWMLAGYDLDEEPEYEVGDRVIVQIGKQNLHAEIKEVYEYREDQKPEKWDEMKLISGKLEEN